MFKISYSEVTDEVSKIGTDETVMNMHLLLFKFQISQYLQMFKTFRELGFSDSHIKEALEKHGLQGEEALNDLVTS